MQESKNWKDLLKLIISEFIAGYKGMCVWLVTATILGLLIFGGSFSINIHWETFFTLFILLIGLKL